MNNQHEVHYCKTCKRRTVHMVNRPNHILQLFLSIITAGLWIPLWIWFSIGCKKHCMNHYLK